jgi:hypothetical protein
MGTITFDRLKYVEVLKASGVSEAQARAHAKALSQALAEAPDLVTRSDLREGAASGDQNRGSKTDIIKWFVTSLFAQAAVIVALLQLPA